MTWCEVCGETIMHSVFHHCPPGWRVWCPEDHEAEDGVVVYARSPGAAAEKWVEENDPHMDYRVVAGGEVELLVCLEHDYNSSLEVEGVKRFKVTGEAVPTYDAKEVDL